MATALVLSLLLPQLAVAPYPCEVGAPAVVTAAVRGDDGAERAVPGLELFLAVGDEPERAIGVTDADGRLQFVPEVAALMRVVARRDGVRWVAPLQVVPAPRRWPFAAICLPLGLALLVCHLRTLRRRAGAADQASTLST